MRAPARRRWRRDQRGAVAIMVALSMVMLCLAAALLIDLGLLRVDRQQNKSAADSAAMAGAYALTPDDSTPEFHPFAAVCDAMEYLQVNDPDFESFTTEDWSDGNGSALPSTPAPCSDAKKAEVCTSNPGTWAQLTAANDEGVAVRIQSGYLVSAGDWPEESIIPASDDSAYGGCDQVAVMVTQVRDATLGTLSADEFGSGLRSVGRVVVEPGGDAPAMLLLERTGCPVLATGSSGGGSYIHVSGARSSDGNTQAGTIHADTDGSTCSGSIFEGRANNGIVAFAAPQSTDPSLPDPSKPGVISAVSALTNTGISVDNQAYVYGSEALNVAGAAAAAKHPVSGRDLVTRKIVDDRYLNGVNTALDDAEAGIFSAGTAPPPASDTSWHVIGCGATGTINPPSPATKIFVNCTDNGGFRGPAVLRADMVVFNGRVNPNGTVSMPLAEKVYIFGLSGRPAIELTGSSPKLSVHTEGNMSGGLCLTTPTGPNSPPSLSTNKATLIIKEGPIKQNSGQLRFCNTTVLMMGGHSDACLPPLGYSDWPPDSTPCGSSNLLGSGQLSQTGGNVDWTAPNQYDKMTLADGSPDPAKAGAWSDPNGPEDLAFWSESGTDSSNTYNMNGGGQLEVTGVYMVPNADPFIIGGGGHQDLFNAQYVARAIALNGNTTSITMGVDPNAAVTLPDMRFELVR